jgi:hypothetical protein
MDRDNDLHPLAKKRRARLLPFPHCLNCSDWAASLYNGRHGHYDDPAEAKLIMPQVSQHEETKKYYG